MTTPENEVPKEVVEEGAVPSPLNMEEQVTTEVDKQEQERDLTGERDARVIPLVKYLIGVIGSSDIPFNYDATPEAALKEKMAWQGIMDTHFVPKAIENNLQLTDVNYLFQLMQTVSHILQERSRLPQNPIDPKFGAAAMTILKLLGNQENLKINFHNDVGDDSLKRAELYDSFYLNIVEPTFKLYDIKYNETGHVFTAMDKILGYFIELVNTDLNMLRDVADNKLYGMPMSELTVHTLMLKAAEKKVE